LSPVVCCYAGGILLGNLAILEWDTKLARTLSEVSVMLALPMLLLATDFVAWFKLAKTTILSFAILILSVMFMSTLFGHLFKSYDPEVWKMSGMLTGVFIGGTANLTGIGKMLEVRDDVFVTLNAVDVALGGAYLLFVMSFGVKILTFFLKPFKHEDESSDEIIHSRWQQLSTMGKLRNIFILVFVCGISIGISLFLSKIFTGEESAGVIILGLTIIALSLSFVPKIRHFEGGQECGHYFLLVFCVAVGSLANTSEIFSGKLWYFAFCSAVLMGSISLHFFCCFLLRIDRDTAIITSMAGIFGPAFVAPMSDILKNKAILVSGITTGLVGMALGNFAGLFVAWVLK
jgi:uncharacterized membrane protein